MSDGNDTPQTDALVERYVMRADLTYIKALMEHGRDLERQLADARKDTERMHWLESCYHVCIDREPDGYSIHNTQPIHGSIRKAIDKAIQEDKQ